MPPKSTPDLSLFLDILLKLEVLEIPYAIIGAFAATMYGITRATYDIDLIVDLNEAHIAALTQVYPLPRYYADPRQMRSAMHAGSSFNIIDTERGEKADLFPVTMEPRQRPAFTKRVRHPLDMPEPAAHGYRRPPRPAAAGVVRISAHCAADASGSAAREPLKASEYARYGYRG